MRRIITLGLFGALTTTAETQRQQQTTIGFKKEREISDVSNDVQDQQTSRATAHPNPNTNYPGANAKRLAKTTLTSKKENLNGNEIVEEQPISAIQNQLLGLNFLGLALNSMKGPFNKAQPAPKRTRSVIVNKPIYLNDNNGNYYYQQKLQDPQGHWKVEQKSWGKTQNSQSPTGNLHGSSISRSTSYKKTKKDSKILNIFQQDKKDFQNKMKKSMSEAFPPGFPFNKPNQIRRDRVHSISGQKLNQVSIDPSYLPRGPSFSRYSQNNPFGFALQDFTSGQKGQSLAAKYENYNKKAQRSQKDRINFPGSDHLWLQRMKKKQNINQDQNIEEDNDRSRSKSQDHSDYTSDFWSLRPSYGPKSMVSNLERSHKQTHGGKLEDCEKNHNQFKSVYLDPLMFLKTLLTGSPEQTDQKRF